MLLRVFLSFRRGPACVLAFAILFSVSVTVRAQHYIQTNLVSDLPGMAPVTDPNLVNPWGLTSSSTSPWWVADNGKGVSTLYTGAGAKLSLVVTIPPPTGGTPPSAPTGVVFNGTSSFGGATFIFVTEDGTIAARNGGTLAVTKFASLTKAVYKGVTIATANGTDFLYVANFFDGRVDVFDTNFSPTFVPAGAFTDPQIPAGFAPFNVQELNGNLFVAFAKQDADKEDEVAGPGLGYADIFDPNGHLILRLRSGSWMNAPWGVALAPDTGFGKQNGRLLVGQFGSGQIATFDLDHGNFHGMVLNRKGGTLVIDGLWALRFGNGGNAGPKSTLFFTAGIDDEAHGLFGTITTWNRGVSHDEIDDAPGQPVGNGPTLQQPNSVIVPLVILPSEDEEKPGPKKRKSKERDKPEP